MILHYIPTYLTFNIIGLDTIVEVFEEPGLGGRDFSVNPSSWASHVEEVGDNSLHWIPVGGFIKPVKGMV